MNQWELGILDFIQEKFQCGFLDWFMPKVTLFGEHGIFWIALAAVLLITKRFRKVGAMMGVALLLGFLIGNMTLKPLVGRIRPYDMPGMGIDRLLVDVLHDKSFPSGHTLACFEGATVLLLTNKKMGIPALVIAIFVAL